jgi:hypothetical protein
MRDWPSTLRLLLHAAASGLSRTPGHPIPALLTEAEKRRAAIGSWAAMVGAVIMARFSDDPKLSGELFVQTRAWIAGAATSRGRTVTR